MDDDYEPSEENPWGVIKSLQEGKDWVERLENEMLLLFADLNKLESQMTEVTKAAIEYTIAMTEQAIQKIEFEMKMFER